MTLNPKSLCQLEMHTRDPVQSLAFLKEVLGWTPVPVGFQEFTVINVPDDCPFGINLVTTPDLTSPQGTVPYFELDQSLDSIVERSVNLGARVVSGPRVIPGYGHAAVIEEPGGLRLGFYFAQLEGPGFQVGQKKNRSQNENQG